MADTFNNKNGSVGRNRPRSGFTTAGDPIDPVDCNLPTYHVASWKSLEFFVDTSSDEFGRRGDSYEYPLSDDVAWKDLGRKARRFKLEGYLIGTDQLEKSQRMVERVESGEPGDLIHPLFGRQLVACVGLTVTADYRKQKKLTRLAFEFVEAPTSMAPYLAGRGVKALYDAANDAVTTSQNQAWQFDPAEYSGDPVDTNWYRVEQEIAARVRPVGSGDQEALDALDRLLRAGGSAQPPGWQAEPEWFAAPAEFNEYVEIVREVRGPALQRVAGLTRGPTARAPGSTVMSLIPQFAGVPTFNSLIDPINFGSAAIRDLHKDALVRLRAINAYVVDRMRDINVNSAQLLVITTRLILIRDYAWTVAETQFDTVSQALEHLDFIMAVYDDEEQVAVQRCDDVLALAIRTARATAAATILARNIRLPGLAEYPIDGVWPSLVAAHKLFANARRFDQVEAYNPQMSPFFMGRSVITPAS